MRSLICSLEIAASRPSGMRVRSRLFMSLMALRERLSLAPPGMARTRASAVSLWMRPARVRPDVGLDGVGAPAGLEHAVGVEDVAEEGFRGHHFDVGERRAVQICLGRFQNASAATDRVPGAGDIRKAMHERFLMAMHE